MSAVFSLGIIRTALALAIPLTTWSYPKYTRHYTDIVAVDGWEIFITDRCERIS